ncbi:MAG: hypothetical protein A2Y62_13190 [Candidatus Fischerbacteria bacterium RBG_13_37_8]|uniref:Uncharacterized protein n=1 Tax=Candidatus Fischerbacteria bacterium RBG_13_37_8 TaxID=1817863 RepID=A0A1F5VN95_9BACT|nr:MAG: hypothetical protein A2Y62_13190 [Candidatus Fischerbacteria bacterium RBG_13_37_8]
MKKLLLLCALLCLCGVIAAKRAAPVPVSPVVYKGIEYRAPHERMGYVQAWDIKNNKFLWEKKIYDVPIDPKLEEDVQWIFVTSLEMKNDKLIVTNETNEIFSVELEPETNSTINVDTVELKKSKPFTIKLSTLVIIVGLLIVALFLVTHLTKRH